MEDLEFQKQAIHYLNLRPRLAPSTVSTGRRLDLLRQGYMIDAEVRGRMQ